jgi:RNA polymerase sigma-70 factor (ECF subfamily)
MIGSAPGFFRLVPQLPQHRTEMAALQNYGSDGTLDFRIHARPTPILRFMASHDVGSPKADARLVADLVEGDENALGELYDRHGSMCYGLSLSIIKEPAEAEEVVSDAFAQLWRNAASFDTARGSLPAWLATITRSRALDRLRARARGARLLDVAELSRDDGVSLPMHTPAAPDRLAEQSETAELVRRSLAELPEPQRLPIELAYFSGLSQSEIAERLQEPLGTVKSRIRTGMEKLRQMLTPLMQEEG